LEALVDIGELEDYPSNTLPGFVDRLCEWLPTLSEHRCSYGEEGGFVRRLQEGTWPGHILEHVTLELQNIAGTPGGFGRARETGIRGVYKVVVQAWHEEITRACLDAARELVMAAIDNTAYDIDATHVHLREIALRYLLGSNTAIIVDAATATNKIPPKNVLHLTTAKRDKHDLIEEDRNYQRGTQRGGLCVRAPAKQSESIRQNSEDENCHESTQERATTTGQGCSSKNDCRHNRQQIVRSDLG
jgi:hypothetical protein